VGSEFRGVFTYTEKYLFRHIEERKGYDGTAVWQPHPDAGNKSLYDYQIDSPTQITVYDYNFKVTVILTKVS
jgi:hypothetical protein